MAVNVQELFSKRKKNSYFEKKNYEWFHEKTFIFEEELQKKWYSAKIFYIYFSTKTTKEICDLWHIYTYSIRIKLWLPVLTSGMYYHFRIMTKEGDQKRKK